MDTIDRLLEEYPNTMEHFRFATTDAVQSQISAGLKYKTETNNRERIRFTYYSGVLVLKGHGTYIAAEGTSHRLGPGDFFQRFPMQVHSTRVDPNEQWVELYMDLPAALFSALALCKVTDNCRHVLHPGIDIDWVKRGSMLVNELETCEPLQLPSIQARIVLLLEQLLSMDRICSITDQDKRLETARDLLSGTSRFQSVQAVAEYINMGYENFRKLFKRRYGISPNKYHISQKIFLAQDLLMSTGSVRATASTLGYCDEFAFSKQFKQHTSISPLKFIHMNGAQIRSEEGKIINFVGDKPTNACKS